MGQHRDRGAHLQPDVLSPDVPDEVEAHVFGRGSTGGRVQAGTVFADVRAP